MRNMKDMKLRYFCAAVALSLLASCSDGPDETITGSAGNRVQLSANVEGMTFVSTRTAIVANPYVLTAPTAESPLPVALWFSTTSGNYADTPTEYDNTVKFKNTLLTFPDKDVTYPDADDIYCVGLYPKDEWSRAPGNTVATHAINGTQDLMFAPQISGSLSSKFNSTADDKHLQFGHVLTWLRVAFNASSHDAIAMWGNVIKVEILNPHNTVDINLSTGALKYNGESEYLATYDDATGMPLQTTLQTAGSVFCAPPDAVGEGSDARYSYTVRVTMKEPSGNQVTKVVSCTLTDTGGTPITNKPNVIGKEYVLTLIFNPIATIDGICTLENWKDETVEIYP